MTPRAISIGEPQIGPVTAGDCTVLRRWPNVLLRGIAPGDLLWVREPWYLSARFDGLSPTAARPLGARPVFFDQDRRECGSRRPLYTLPRAWHRQHLRVTEVRLEWLQAITDAEIRAEGFTSRRGYELAWERQLAVTEDTRSAREGPRSWSANPEVLVIAFERAGAPIADLPELPDPGRPSRTGKAPAAQDPPVPARPSPASEAGGDPSQPCFRCGAARSCEHRAVADLRRPELEREPAPRRDYSGNGLNFGTRRLGGGNYRQWKNRPVPA